VELRRLLGSADTLLDSLRCAFPDRIHHVSAQRQPSRLYGHSFSDMIALSTIATLAQVEGIEKLAVARRLLEERPELVDLRIEHDGPRVFLDVIPPGVPNRRAREPEERAQHLLREMDRERRPSLDSKF